MCLIPVVMLMGELLAETVEKFRSVVDESEYKGWQIYYVLIPVLVINTTIYFEIRFLTNFYFSLDRTSIFLGITVSELVITGIQSSILGFLGKGLFTEGEKFFKVFNELFNSKEDAFIWKIGIMTVLGVLIGTLLPNMIRDLSQFVVLQSLGVLIVFGYWVVHYGKDWKLINELPIIIAGLILFFGPHFLT